MNRVKNDVSTTMLLSSLGYIYDLYRNTIQSKISLSQDDLVSRMIVVPSKFEVVRSVTLVCSCL